MNLRLRACLSSLAWALALHLLLLVSSIFYARSHWRFSRFYDLDNAALAVDQVVDQFSSRISELPDVHEADPASQFCVSIQSIDRAFPYLWVTVGSLLLQPWCHQPPVRLFRPEGHQSFLEPIAPKVPLRTLGTTAETPGYAEVMRGCEDLDKPYTLVLEDDVWVTSRLEQSITDIIAALEEEEKTKDLCYVKLFTPSLVNWGLAEFCGYVLMVGLPYAGFLRLAGLWYGARDWPRGIRPLLALAFVAGELWIMGRNDFKSKLPINRYFQNGQAFSSLAMLYPKASVSLLADCLLHPELINGSTENHKYHLTDEWLRQCCLARGLRDYISVPHLVQHIGATSSRTRDWFLFQTAYFYP